MSKLGLFLMSLGAKLYFNDENKEIFKHKLNKDTWIGAQAQSGGHILQNISPITDFEVESIVNVLKDEGEGELFTIKYSTKVNYAHERWVP